MKLVNHLDANKNQLQNALLHNLTPNPTPAAGDKGYAIFNITDLLAKVWNGTTFDTISNVLEGVTGTAPIVAGAITAKSQAISITAASGGAAGSMSSAHYSLVNGATNANTASTLVQRDGSGNFIAGTITANLTGTASIATTLAPTADVPMGSHKLTGLTDPTSAQDAATKNYVDALAIGLDVKASVRAATTANIAGATYANTGGASARGQFTTMPNILDGVTLAANNRILVKDQTTGGNSSRGLWVVTTLGSGANGVWDRASDYDTDAEVTSGSFTFVEEGTVNSTSGWVLSTINPITIGGASGTSLVFNQFSGGGTYTAGNGLTLIGTTFDVVGTTNRISVAADSIDISSAYVGQATITTLGTITTGTWNGTTLAVANGGTGVTTAPAAGSMIYAVSTTQYGSTGAGSAGQILTSGGAAIPAWVTLLPIANGGTNSSATATAGGVGYGTGTAHAYTAAGTAGYLLTSGGASAPAWVQTLPIANGGTNSTATATAGGVAYGTGTAYAVTAAGTAGYILTSGGASVPAWVQSLPIANGGTASTTAAGAKTALGFMTRYAQTFGDGAATSYTITHSLGTLDVTVALMEVATGLEVEASITHATTNTITAAFTVAPASNALRIVCIG